MEYPNLGDSAFPNAENVDVWKYANFFDYRRWVAQSVVTLAHAPFTSDYSDVVECETVRKRDEMLNSLPRQTLPPLESHFRLDAKGDNSGRDIVKLPVPFEVASRFNYLYIDLAAATSANLLIDFEDTEPPRRFCFFIEGLKQGAPSTTHFELTLDVWHTYRPYIEVFGYFLERGHAPVACSATPATYLSNPIENTEHLLADDISYDSKGRAVMVKPMEFDGNKYTCFAVAFNPEQLLAFAASPAADGGESTPPTYFDTNERNGYQKGVSGYRWGSLRDYGDVFTPNPVAYANGSPDTPTPYVYAVKASEAPAFFDRIRTTNLNFMRQISAVFTVNERFVELSPGFDAWGYTLHTVNTSPEKAELASISFTPTDFNYPDEYKRFTKLYTSPYAWATVTDNRGNIHRVATQELSGESALVLRSVIAAPSFKNIANLQGVGGTGETSYSWQRTNGNTANGAIPVSQFDEKLWEYDIPTYQLTVSASQLWEIDNALTNESQRLNALTAYKNGAASANTVYENALDSAQTGKDTGDASALTGKENSDASALASKTNSDRSARTGKENSDASALASKTNSDRSALTGKDNSNRSALTAKENSDASALAGKTTGDRSALTAKTNADRSANTAYANVERSNAVATANTALNVAASIANQGLSNDNVTGDVFYGSVVNTNLVAFQTQLQLDLLEIEREATTSSTVWSAATSIIGGAATGGIAGAVSGTASAVGNAVNATIQYGAKAAEVKANNNYRRDNTAFTNQTNTNLAKAHVKRYSEMTNNSTSAQTAQTANTVSGSHDNAERTRDAAKTSNSNTYTTSTTNNNTNYNTTTTNNKNTYDTATINNQNTYDTATTNNQNTYDTTITNNKNTYDTTITNNQNTYDTTTTNNKNTYDTTTTNNQNTYDTTTTNNKNTYNTTITNNQNTYNTTTTNNQNTYDTTITNNQNTYDTTITNNLSNYNTSASNSGYSRGTSIENLKRSLENAQNVYDLSYRQAQLGASSAITSSAGDFTRDALGLNGFAVRLFTPKSDEIARIGDFFARYGYASNRYWSGNVLTKMRHFTYIKASDVRAYSEKVDATAFNVFKEILQKGTTVWNNVKEVNRIGYYDNWA